MLVARRGPSMAKTLCHASIDGLYRLILTNYTLLDLKREVGIKMDVDAGTQGSLSVCSSKTEPKEPRAKSWASHWHHVT